MGALKEKHCTPCEGGVPALPLEEREKLLKELNSGWKLTHNNSRIKRELKFNDFKKAMDLANDIGSLAEKEWHHPEISMGWGHLEVEIWTHKIDSLVESDFILAAKIDSLLKS